MCHHIGLHPYTHGVTTAQDHHLSHALNTEQLGLDVNVDVVGKESLVEGVVGGRYNENLQHTGLSFEGLHADLFHLAGQLRGGRRNLVLYIHRRHIGVGALFEIDHNLGSTGVGGGGGHIGHVLHTVDGFLERCDDGFLYRFGTRTIVLRHNHDGRRCNVRVLLNRQCLQADDTQQHYQNRYDG